MTKKDHFPHIYIYVDKSHYIADIMVDAGMTPQRSNNMNIEKIEDSINTLEERWGNLECKLIQHEEGSERYVKIKKAMDECESAIAKYKALAVDKANTEWCQTTPEESK